MDAKNLIAELGKALNLPNFKMNEKGLCRLILDQHLPIDFEEDENHQHLHLYSVLGPVPLENPTTLFRQLLEANFFGRQTQGANLSLDEELDEIVLCRTLEVEKTSVEELKAAIEALGATVHRLKPWVTGEAQALEASSQEAIPLEWKNLIEGAMSEIIELKTSASSSKDTWDNPKVLKKWIHTLQPHFQHLQQLLSNETPLKVKDFQAIGEFLAEQLDRFEAPASSEKPSSPFFPLDRA